MKTAEDNTEAAKLNWKTTVGGFLVAAGKLIRLNVHSSIAYWVGEAMEVIGVALLGATAADAPVKK